MFNAYFTGETTARLMVGSEWGLSDADVELHSRLALCVVV
jgi:hypothetical protein